MELDEDEDDYDYVDFVIGGVLMLGAFYYVFTNLKNK
jgi:hypothetical protein